MNEHRQFKDRLYEQFARVGRALANPHRLELIDLLAQGERSVEDLAREAAMSVANTSRHLQELKSAGLVEVRREGHYGYYRLADAEQLNFHPMNHNESIGLSWSQFSTFLASLGREPIIVPLG
jgi:DNA-binding transcriptional ArsR family regulator